jgi:hypothetical protein
MPLDLALHDRVVALERADPRADIGGLGLVQRRVERLHSRRALLAEGAPLPGHLLGRRRAQRLPRRKVVVPLRDIQRLARGRVGVPRLREPLVERDACRRGRCEQRRRRRGRQRRARGRPRRRSRARARGRGRGNDLVRRGDDDGARVSGQGEPPRRGPVARGPAARARGAQRDLEAVGRHRPLVLLQRVVVAVAQRRWRRAAAAVRSRARGHRDRLAPPQRHRIVQPVVGDGQEAAGFLLAPFGHLLAKQIAADQVPLVVDVPEPVGGLGLIILLVARSLVLLTRRRRALVTVRNVGQRVVDTTA